MSGGDEYWKEIVFSMHDQSQLELTQQLEHVMLSGRGHASAPPALLFTSCQTRGRGIIVVRPAAWHSSVHVHIVKASILGIVCTEEVWHGRCRLCHALLEYHYSCPCLLYQHDHCGSRAITSQSDSGHTYRLCCACWS